MKLNLPIQLCHRDGSVDRRKVTLVSYVMEVKRCRDLQESYHFMLRGNNREYIVERDAKKEFKYRT
jgi:hypothetical protein